MSNAPVLADLKADWRTFQAVTGIGQPAQHHKSFLRDERHGSLSVWMDDAGAIRWRDHGTGDGGSVIDAAAMLWRCTDAEAIRRLLEAAGHSPGQNGHNGQNSRPDCRSVHSGRSVTPSHGPKSAPPKPDRERLRAFLAEARRHALEGHPDAVRYAKRRGLELAAVAER